MSEIIDGQDADITANGVPVGGIHRYRFFEGTPQVIAHRGLKSPTVEYRPAQPDYGTATLELYRDHSDQGQQILAHSKASREIVHMSLDLKDGTILNFTAFCESMPLIGGRRNGGSIAVSQCRIRLTGQLVPAT